MKSETKNILIAGATGLAVGAVLGVLFAPAEGKKTRAKIKKKADNLIDKLPKSAEETEDLFKGIKQKLESSLSNGKSEVKEDLMKQIEALEESIKKA